MKVYLDNAATTPLDPQVLKAMLPFLREKFGNASSIHSWGREARATIDKARDRVAEVLGCKAQEIIFTGTTTESDNLAIVGVFKAAGSKFSRPHLVTSSIEHHGVLDVFKALEKNGAEVTYLKVDKYGLVDPSCVAEAVKENTILVSIMYANNEVGTIQPLAEIGKKLGRKIYFHTDAAAGKYLDLNVDRLGVDLLSLGPHKFYGPKGVGILYVRRGTPIASIVKGGMHEYGLRPGTENVAGIVGAGESLALIARIKNQKSRLIAKLRDRLIRGVLSKIPGSRLTGHPEKRVPDIASFIFEGAEGEAILLSLDQEGIGASSGSACTSGLLEPSHVLTAMGISPELAHGSVRFSLGKETTQKEIDYVLEKLPPIIKRLRRMAPK